MGNLVTAVLAGLGDGAVYALIAVSFVIIFRATGVLNFAQPGLLILGTFFTSVLAVDQGLPFWVAVALAMLIVAVISMGIERVAIRPMIGRPVFSTALVTVGLFIMLLILAFRLFAARARTINDPWQLDQWCLVQGEGSCTVAFYQHHAGKIVVVAVVLAVLGLWLSRSRTGLAMRATSLDQEAALAQGINVGRMFSLAWGIGGALAALAGILLAANGSVVQANDALFALVALPALILGGIDSLRGALVGGLVMGIVSALARTYQPVHAPWLGPNFENVAPYLVMILVLLIRPYGLFGTKEVQRV
ncbi:branched-chain amino acid ABC transporter permease [Ornithinimicrobium sp. F0845]|uniref:branched-chain amino acid ABC transporter permease n=1 Tax=Ornithinimicrobium sp. F0845 TaxID=2926412 RepID=UPI001FF2B045|nr:branched-chain amino acid ABC transporter permease [Ornithinimicrobium sp. F0845]MCK0111172.1 branched-chain amino acid ABC transporter permease [Ornithinimicrobium sp. F0845]